jgi:hypothetical protein
MSTHNNSAAEAAAREYAPITNAPGSLTAALQNMEQVAFKAGYNRALSTVPAWTEIDPDKGYIGRYGLHKGGKVEIDHIFCKGADLLMSGINFIIPEQSILSLPVKSK